MLLTNAVMVLWGIVNREQWEVCSLRCSERGLQPRICDRVIRVDDIPVLPGWKGRLSLILLLANDITGEEGSGSGLGDVGDEVFADVDIAYKGATLIKPFSSGKRTVRGWWGENRFETDFNIFPDLPHFLGHIRKAGQTFLSTISQSLDPHFTRGWRGREETN